MEKIRIGVSSCLLGNKVRYDGQHKLDHFITDTLSQWCELIPVCPEVECGLAIPRESMRLVGEVENPRLMTSRTGIDHTERMLQWTVKKLKALEKEELVGFIFKSKSPSSGMKKVKVYNTSGQTISYAGIGLFAGAFMRHFPDIPVEDEGRLKDQVLRENFIETLFVLQRWREAIAQRKVKDVIEFHSRHKYTLMAHSSEKLRALGKLTARSGSMDFETLAEQYRAILIESMRLKKTIRKNYNVLLHIFGYFKKQLTAEEKKEFLEAAENYYQELCPLMVPLTLLKHYTMKYHESYLKKQYFLNPHPVELKLLNILK